MNSRRLFLYHLLMHFVPPTSLFGLKRHILGWCGAEIDPDVRICSSVRFLMTGRLKIGKGSWLGHEVLIVGGDALVEIGSNVDIAPRVTMVTGSHQIGGEDGRAAGPGYSVPIIIGDGAWIGAGATITGGSRVGAGAIVAAGALVRSHVAEGDIVGGVPAKLISKRQPSSA